MAPRALDGPVLVEARGDSSVRLSRRRKPARGAPRLPPSVEARLEDDAKVCDAGKLALESGFMHRADVNGDGIADYLLDYRSASCAGGPSYPFCGSGGCTFVIFASLPGGAFAPVFEDQDEPDFYGRRAGRPTLDHTARYSSCHSNDYSQCHEISIWDGSAFIEHAVKHASPSGDGVEAKAGSAIPAAVRDELATEAAACPSGKLRREPGFLERRDVNADGKPDYVLRWRAARCVGTADHGWCKAGRCLTEVFASRPDGTYARAYDTDDAVTFQRHNGVMAMEFPATCARQKQTSCSILEWVDGGFLGLPTILG